MSETLNQRKPPMQGHLKRNVIPYFGSCLLGFNGKENDTEVNGAGSQQGYGMRIYDTRLGEFLSNAPFAKEYPWNSTYVFAENADKAEYIRRSRATLKFSFD